MPTKEWLDNIEAKAKIMADGPNKDEHSSAYWTHWGTVMSEYVQTVTPQVVLELIDMARSGASVLRERADLLKNDKRFKHTEYVVEADSDDRTNMWRDWATEAKNMGRDWAHRVEWVQDSAALIVTAGDIGPNPVALYLEWAMVNKSLVVFWDATGRYVDYDLIEQWLKLHFPNAREHTDKIERVISEQNHRRKGS